MILLFLILSQAPSFTLKDLDNNEVVLDSLLKKGPVVLEFWATWCKYCIKQLNSFKELNEKFENVTFVGINEDGPRTQRKVPLVVKSWEWEFLILYDDNQKILKLFQVQALPHTFIIGKNREILYQHIGYRKKDEEQIAKKLLSILKETKLQETELEEPEKSD